MSIAFEIGRKGPLFVGRERTVALVVGISPENVLVRRNQKPGSTTGRVENGFVFLRVNDRDDEVDDVARRTELPGVPLRAKDREQIFKSIAQPLTVIVGELVNDLEKGTQSLRVAVGQIGVVEDVAEQQRNARIFRHPGDRFSV